MDRQEIKEYIAGRVTEGVSLSHIQDELKAKGVKMTFMELRLIASEIESGVFKAGEKAAEPAAPEKTPAPQQDAGEDMPVAEEDVPFGSAEEDMEEGPLPGPDASSDDAGEAPEKKLRGKTTVSLSRIQRPGLMASGSVTFGSGASGEWFLDQMGRLGFEKMEGKPDQQDIQEFQMELRKAFGA